MYIQPGASEVHQAETHSPAKFADPGTLRAQQKSWGHALAVAKELHSSAVTYLTSSTHCLTISNRTSARSNAQGKLPVFPPVTIVNPQARAWRSGSMLCIHKMASPCTTPVTRRAGMSQATPPDGLRQSWAQRKAPPNSLTSSPPPRAARMYGAERTAPPCAYRYFQISQGCHAAPAGMTGKHPRWKAAPTKRVMKHRRTGQSNASRQAGYPAAKRHPQQVHTAARTPRSRAAAGADGTTK